MPTSRRYIQMIMAFNTCSEGTGLMTSLDVFPKPTDFKRLVRNVVARHAVQRFPTLNELNLMRSNERSFSIERRIVELREERSGVLSGYIMPWNGWTKAQLLRSCRRRLRHAERVAEELGIEIHGDDQD
jgi:hypothetical protein